MVIGVVGKIGSGKSAFIKYIINNYSSYRIISYSCDDVAKELIASGKTLYKWGSIRPYDFFTNEKCQLDARTYLHPEVFKNVKELIDDDINCRLLNSADDISKTIYVVESALPIELMYDICDKVIYIKSDFDNSFERLKKSRNYTENQTKLIYNSQKYYEKFYNLADYVIINNGSKDEFMNRIKEVFNEICVVC